MKKTILLVMLVFAFACDKDDHDNETLPPATQSGKGTFACYVDGKPFIDKSGGWFNCYYQLLEGKYYFNVRGIFPSEDNPRTIAIGTENKSISEGETLLLIARENGNAWAGGGFRSSDNSSEPSFTSNSNTGELTITKLDFERKIVSGAFWFNIKHPTTGKTIEIREGRFDTLFTQ